MLKEVIRPPFTRANSKPTPSVRTQTTPSPARTQTIPLEPKGMLITSYAKAFKFFFLSLKFKKHINCYIIYNFPIIMSISSTGLYADI
jgi:hypothetical protein